MIQQKKMRFSVLFLAGTAVFLMGYSLWMPKAMIETAKKALSVCAESILPSLALFSVCAKMLLKSGAVRLLCEMHLPFRAEVVTAFLIGLVSGFPTGAATLSALTEKGLLSRKDAEKLLPFCNLAGPSFTLGTVGILFFGDAFLGRILFLAQFFAAFFGICLFTDLFSSAEKRKYEEMPSSVSFFSALSASVCETVPAMLSVCGFVVFFALASDAFLRVFEGFGLAPSGFFRFLCGGFLELSSGLLFLSETVFSSVPRLFFGGILIGFGGISVFLQALDRTEHFFYAPGFYLFGKILCAFLCAVFSVFFFLLEKNVYSVFWKILIVLSLLFGMILLNFLKNKVFFKKVWKNRKECCIIYVR